MHCIQWNTIDEGYGIHTSPPYSVANLRELFLSIERVEHLKTNGSSVVKTTFCPNLESEHAHMRWCWTIYEWDESFANSFKMIGVIFCDSSTNDNITIQYRQMDESAFNYYRRSLVENIWKQNNRWSNTELSFVELFFSSFKIVKKILRSLEKKELRNGSWHQRELETNWLILFFRFKKKNIKKTKIDVCLFRCFTSTFSQTTDYIRLSIYTGKPAVYEYTRTTTTTTTTIYTKIF